MLKLISYNPLNFLAFSNYPLIYIINTPDFLSYIDRYKNYLTAEEVARADRFIHREDQQRFIIARGCLREVLGHFLHRLPQDIIFQTNEYGKLFLKNYPLHFNISHAHEKIVIAIDQYKEVGIDVEFISRDLDYLELAQRFFHPEEFNYLSQLPAEKLQQNFFAIWTAKEAVVKCIGKGLSQLLDEFTVTTIVEHQKYIGRVNLKNTMINLYIQQVEVGYLVALAYLE